MEEVGWFWVPYVGFHYGHADITPKQHILRIFRVGLRGPMKKPVISGCRPSKPYIFPNCRAKESEQKKGPMKLIVHNADDIVDRIRMIQAECL